MKQEMIDLMTKIYGEAYSAEYIAQTVDLYMAGVRDVRLPDIAVTLLDKYGFYGPWLGDPDPASAPYCQHVADGDACEICDADNS